VSGGEYLALAYGAAFVVVLAYVAIIAAKLARLERQTAELLQLAAERRSSAGSEVPSGDPATSRIS
jgi:CcmD family protein